MNEVERREAMVGGMGIDKSGHISVNFPELAMLLLMGSRLVLNLLSCAKKTCL